MTLVALPCAVVLYSTCELVTRRTVTNGAGTGGEGIVGCDAYKYVYHVYIHHVQSHTRANCPMQHVYVNIYNFSALCGFCLHVTHTMAHNQVHSVCSVCVPHVY